MSITFLRHGAVALKLQRRYLGHSDISIDKNLFEFEKVKDLVNKKFDFVYASALKRTGQTLAMLGHDFVEDSRLNEVRFKDEIELKSFDEVSKLASYDEMYLETYEKWSEYICFESMKEFEKRVQSFVDELPKDKNILICTHGGVMKVIFDKHFEYLDFVVI